MDTTSPSLLQRLRGPLDHAAWSQFVDLNTPLMFSWARKVGLNEADAADLVQDVFALLVQKLPTFDYDGSKSFRGWLRTVTLNKWREHARKRHPRTANGTVRFEDVPDPEGDDAFWDKEYQQHLLCRALKLVSAEFQPITWRAFNDYVVAGRNVSQVAQALGLSKTAVYIAKSRVLRRLRERISGLVD